MHPTFILILTLLPLCDSLLGLGQLQSIAVEGKLNCYGHPIKDVKVMLYDKELISDKKLDEKRTNGRGRFRVSGSKREFTNIDPKIDIYHKCGYQGPCYKKITLDVPTKYISKGDKPVQTFKVENLNLASKIEGETIACID
ncbi:Transthyretin family and Immunoglobulin fold domain-containing protein [Trichostrongylus colubriformis]|uniref:Transthyretin family and Immunoglobulin fold domain-containing protein n=1 Tax=Trichostrongylus colubriformis TaxID=6319 RepID=A0AAN8IB87_TRICO